MRLRDLSDNTIDSYSNWLGQFYARINAPIDKATASQVLEFIHYVVSESDFQPSTINQSFYSLRLYYRDFLKRKHLEWDIWDQFKIRRSKTIPTVLTQEEVQLLLSHVQKERYRIVFMTKYLCGLRVSEVVRIKPEHINSKRMVLQVIESKGKKSREVPLCSELYQALREHWKTHRNPEWLFPAQAGSMNNCKTHILENSIRIVCRKAAEESGLKARHKNLTPHTLRHSYATHLLEQGACIRAVSAYLGHTSLETTMIYLHMTQVSEERARQVISGLAQKQF